MFGFGNRNNKKVKKLFSIHSIMGGRCEGDTVSFCTKFENINIVRAYDEADAVAVFLCDYPYVTDCLIRKVKEVTPAERK